ncbi:MAG: aminotransferase class V-fold PLP-dependent enzyme [Thermoanaerobaculia bacterium]
MSRYPLEPDPEQMKRLVDEAMKRIVPHVESLPRQRAADTDDTAAVARALVEPIPEEPEEYGKLLDLLFERAVPKSFNAAGPGYLAYIPGGGLFHTAVADLISDSFNRYVGVWAAAPALVQLEANVTRWFCGIVGLPETSGGVLTTGGSLANFMAVVAARRDRLPEDFLGGTIYASDQVHHSVEKAAILAGFPQRNIRKISSDERYRIRLDEIADAIDADARDGRTPFLVVGSAGTTNSGAVDDLDAIASLAKEKNLWMHVDAAYGGFFMLTERGRRVMRGIEKADSVTLDPHKGLFLPYGTGSLLVRDLETLRRAHTSRADYMPPMQEERDFVDFCEISPELSRGFRGLRVWLPMKMLGIGPFRAALEEKLELTRWVTDELRTIDGIEIVAEPQLSIVAFRWVPEGAEDLDALNRTLMQRINERNRVHLTGTMLGGKFVIRICVLSFRTHLDRMQMCIEDIKASSI